VLKRILVGLVAFPATLLLLLAINAIAGALLRSARFDLTEEELYTLSEGSRSIVRGLDEPLHFDFFFSKSLSEKRPDLKTYADRVRELLEEFAFEADGKIVLRVIDPQPFSEQEEQAAAAGLKGVAVGYGEALYFGLVGKSSTDERTVIEFFEPERERSLEYDLARMLNTLAHPERKVVGIVTSLPLDGGAQDPMAMMQRRPPEPAWVALQQIEGLFETRMLGSDFASIEGDVDVLLLVHPKNLAPAARYAIDQFVLSGKKAIVFVDPHCEGDNSGRDPTNPLSGMGAPKSSELKDLLAAWGVELVESKVLGDRTYAIQVPTGSRDKPELVTAVVYQNLREEAFNADDPVTSQLTSMILVMPGIVRPLADAKTTFTPLLSSSTDAMQIDAGEVQFYPDFKQMVAHFVPDASRFAIAARVTGEVDSAFAEGKPAPAPGEEPPVEEGTGPVAHLARSSGPINVIVVADADLFEDRTWLREETLFGQISLGWTQFSDNCDFVLNALENLAGGEDLIAIRAHGKVSRPFTKVEEIQKKADQRLLSEQEELQQKLNEAQRRLDELQKEKAADEKLILSPEQKAEIERFEADRLATKKRLREVQFELRRDVEALGQWLKVANIGAVPAVIISIALVMWIVRMGKRGARP
jgi:ABC-type uncharacterized transport system involved in gliding motility auxiliary subunit